MNYHTLVANISRVHQEALSVAAGAVNRHLLLRNWLTGAHLVEFEQRGEDRAAYGSQLLPRLADVASDSAISSSVMTKLSAREPTSLPAHKILQLSWTHWVEILRLDNLWKRTRLTYHSGLMLFLPVVRRGAD